MRDSEDPRFASALELTMQMLLNHPSQTKITGTTLQPLPCLEVLAEVDGVALEVAKKNPKQYQLYLGSLGDRSLTSSQKPPLMHH